MEAFGKDLGSDQNIDLLFQDFLHGLGGAFGIRESLGAGDEDACRGEMFLGLLGDTLDAGAACNQGVLSFAGRALLRGVWYR